MINGNNVNCFVNEKKSKKSLAFLNSKEENSLQTHNKIKNKTYGNENIACVKNRKKREQKRRLAKVNKNLNKEKEIKQLSTATVFSGIQFLKYIGYFFIFYLFFKTKIMGEFSPSFFGFYLSLVALNENIFYISLIYFFATVVSETTAFSLLFSVICCLSGVVLHVILNKNKDKRLFSFYLFLTALVLGIFHISFSFYNLKTAYYSIVNVILNILFMFCTTHFLKILKARNFNFNLNIDEIVCACVPLSIFFCGVENLNIFAFDISKFFGLLCVVFSSLIFPFSVGVSVGVVCGLGCFLAGGNLSYLTLFSVVGAFCFIFKNSRKIYPILAFIFVDICFSLFLNLFGNFYPEMLLPTISVAIIFLLLPQKILDYLSGQIFVYRDKDILKNALNQNKLLISKKLQYTAEIFYEMQRNFRKLISGNLDIVEAKKLVSNELIRNCCTGCKNKDICLKSFKNQEKIFEDLVNAGFEKGKASLVDFSPYLTSRCTKLNQVVSMLNSLIESYREYEKGSLELDSSKLMVSEQLRGVSQVLQNLSKEAKFALDLDYRLSEEIKEALIYNNIIPSEVLVFQEDERDFIMSIVLRGVDFDNDKISSLLSSILKVKMQIIDSISNIGVGLVLVTYKSAPKYSVAIGVASTIKGGSSASGDTYSVSKLDNNRVIFAICDGMGSGEKASEKSEVSMGLIEDFYKAGYDDSTVISCVNRLLNLTSQEVFSAVDIGVVDLTNGEVNFIKQGATVGFIKKNDEVFTIESNSLPLGILKNVAPKITKTILNTDDIVIMTSDGVVDAFGEENFAQFLSNLPVLNPQEMADMILSKARLRQKNYTADDMTILVSKIFYNYA